MASDEHEENGKWEEDGITCGGWGRSSLLGRVLVVSLLLAVLLLLTVLLLLLLVVVVLVVSHAVELLLSVLVGGKMDEE